MQYAYMKRAQVILMEEFTKLNPNLMFLSCHPGWVDTPGVESAYGTDKKYIEPMRNLYQGSEGIAWLGVTHYENLRSGEFYLDRTI
jgi:dehydrogenase/reductase SDR family protein 12